MNVFNVYPWLISDWNNLFRDGARLHHALLIAGRSGIGKVAFAEAVAARLLCESSQPDTAPCGVCDSCRWLLAGNHPDFRQVVADESGSDGAEEETAKATPRSAGTGAIKIDQVRELEDFVNVGSHRGGRRVVLIAPAEAMNAAAANALLKMLEEPPANVHFLLVSVRWRRLLPTLRSRCSVLMLGRPDRSAAEGWLGGQGVAAAAAILDACGGEPLTALRWVEASYYAGYEAEVAALSQGEEGVLQLSGRWDADMKRSGSLSLESRIDLLQKWVADLVRAKLSIQACFYPHAQAALGRLAARADLTRLQRCYNELLDIRAVCNHPLNTRLFLEDLAARYLRCLKTETI